MGAWGHTTFENDDALNWASELEGAEDSKLLRTTLEHVTKLSSDEVLEAPDASFALAAAEVVAALLGNPDANLPEEVALWAEGRRGRHERSLAPLALLAIGRIRTNSELKELWEEGDGKDWHAALDDLTRRLKL